MRTPRRVAAKLIVLGIRQQTMHSMDATQNGAAEPGTVNLVVIYALILGKISQLPADMRRFIARALAIKTSPVRPRR